LEERCRSPLNPNCGGRDIAVYIVFDGKRLPICQRCWEQIAETDLEWGEGVSKAKLKRQVEEAQKAILEKAMREAIEKAAAKFVRNLKSRGGSRAKRQPSESGLQLRDSG